jgi:hypothetical protein
MAKRLAGQWALVTGASSGIGAWLARVLAEEGANLVITARRKDRLEALAGELRQRHQVEVRVEDADLARPDAAQELFARCQAQGLAIDVLVNNAGLGAYQRFVDVEWEKHLQLMQVNMVALTQLTRLFLPAMVARRHGHVMNVASIGAYIPTPFFSVYTASKAFVRNFTEALDWELRGTGVRACVVCPGGTATEFLDAADQTLKGGGEKWLMPAETCARIAVKKMLRGRRTIITGFGNALSMWLLRFLPRAWLPGLAARGMGAAVEAPTSRQLPG